MPLARRRPRDPDHARRRLPRRPADRAVASTSRTSRRCSGSPSRSTTRCSWSAASARSCAAAGRRRRPSRSPSRRAARPSTFSGLAVAIGLSGLLLFEPAALRSFGIGGAIVVAASVVLRADVPAGRPRHARPARQRAQRRRRCATASGGCSAGRRRRRGRRPRVALGADGPLGHGAARSSSSIPTLAFLLVPRHAVPAPRAGHPRRVDPARRASRAARRRSRSQTSSARARPSRSSSSPTSTARRPTPANVQRSSTTRRPSMRVDGDRPGRGPVRRLKDPATGADARRRRHRRPVRRAPRPAAAGARRRPRPARGRLHPRLDRPARRDQPARRRSARPAPRSSRSSATVAGRRRHGPGRRARRRTATTSWPASRRAIPCGDRADRSARARVILFLLFGSVVIPIKAVLMTLLSITRLVRRARLDLPGGQPLERRSGFSRPGSRSPATRSSCSASCSGCRWTTRSCCCRGSRRRTAGPATTPRRSPRAWRRPPASSPARR